MNYKRLLRSYRLKTDAFRYRLRRWGEDKAMPWIEKHQATLRLIGWIVVSAPVAFLLLALADPYAQPPQKVCGFGWGWFGCVLANHESLAGGCFTLVAALIAWAAIQEQLRASSMDRQTARSMLVSALEWQAEGVGATWRILEKLDDAAPAEVKETHWEAARYACEQISEPAEIASYRQMASLLSWKERMRFEQLLRELEGLQQINWAANDWVDDVLGRLRSMAWLYEYLAPKSSEHFEGLFQRTPKAWTFGDHVRRRAGVED